MKLSAGALEHLRAPVFLEKTLGDAGVAGQDTGRLQDMELNSFRGSVKCFPLDS